jgi:primosomal protein N' (replication factor Y)
MSIRKLSGYTPFFHITQIILMDKDVKKVLKESTKIVMKLRQELEDNVIVLGPVLPKIARINNFFRSQIIIKYKESKYIDKTLKDVYQQYSEDFIIAIDKNPSLL